MDKVSKITLKSNLSDSDMEDFDKMFDESMSTAVGDSDESYNGENMDSESKSEDVSDFFEKPESSNMFLDNNSAKSSVSKSFIEEKSLEEKLNDIYNEFIEDTTITIANIKDIAFREAAIKGRWCSRLMAERVRGKRLRQALDTLLNDLKNIANSKSSEKSFLLSAQRQKDAVMTAINENAQVIALRNEISDSKEIEQFLSKLYDCISGLGYTVKNSLDVLNLERGI